eukprot:CAMPEP_0203757024 /NCGR_PEP_ID=MMETSP0098-20131031/10190_1 /ASSEMBLY_ACC=CAM_ASM_000208 /TAXON_ID=96639 /ORGANISM=" , Strain NY0313808BC1" /LENGTH=608 /DNA_ID=CAMNT_0050649117 /DNA_START=317 /DNA_END=2140 /DNA_ORIENTATION=+
MERRSHGKRTDSRRTGFQCADEDVPVLELHQSGVDHLGTVSEQTSSRGSVISAPGRAHAQGLERTGSHGNDSVVSEYSGIPHKPRMSDRSMSFSLNRDYDEEHLEEGKPVHVAELLVGVVANYNDVTDPKNYDNSSIFESFFDLTHARLEHIFKMFDELSLDKEKGILDYENFRRSLRDAGLEIKDKQSFERLVKKVDLDLDGGITFSEFETVVQSLKMAHMFRANQNQWENSFRVINYNTKRALEEIVKGAEIKNFMYAPRPDWASNRWIELTLPATFIMKCLSIKHRLHPLALEDALADSSKMRAKVDRYDTHIFIVFPLLDLVYESDDGTSSRFTKTSVRSPTERDGYGTMRSRSFSYSRSSSTVREPLIEKAPSVTSVEQPDDKIEKIEIPRVRKTNCYIFLSRPEFKTIISIVGHESRNRFRRVRRELGVSYSRLRTHDGMYLVYTMLDVIVDAYTPLVEEMEDLLNRLACQVRLQRKIISYGKNEFNFSNSYHDMLQEVNNLKRWMIPAQRVVANLILEEITDADCKTYLRDVHDHLEQISDDINSILQGVEALKAEHDHGLEVKMNGTMNALTIVATAVLPAQFLTGVFGMNFEDMPELHW